jgi:hypothetical protein
MGARGSVRHGCDMDTDYDGWPEDGIEPASLPIVDQLAVLERAWRAGSPTAMLEALALCHRHERPPPGWLLEAVLELANAQFRPRDKRNYHSNEIHYTRWDAVVEARERHDINMTWEKGFRAVSRLLRHTEAKGAPETIEASYKIVQRAMREERGGQFYQSPAVKVTRKDRVKQP